MASGSGCCTSSSSLSLLVVVLSLALVLSVLDPWRNLVWIRKIILPHSLALVVSTVLAPAFLFLLALVEVDAVFLVLVVSRVQVAVGALALVVDALGQACVVVPGVVGPVVAAHVVAARGAVGLAFHVRAVLTVASLAVRALVALFVLAHDVHVVAVHAVHAVHVVAARAVRVVAVHVVAVHAVVEVRANVLGRVAAVHVVGGVLARLVAGSFLISVLPQF